MSDRASSPLASPEQGRSGPVWWRSIRASFIFMTRIPVGGFPYRKADWAHAPAHFPLVGIVVGMISGGLMLLCQPLGAPLAAALAVVLSMMLTGAFHEDGLADTADALGGAHGSKKVHEILKDSRLGTFGVAALTTSIGLRVLLLAELGFSYAFALPWVHAVARALPVALMVFLPYVSEEGSKGSQVASGRSRLLLMWALAWAGVSFQIPAYFGLPPVHLLLAASVTFPLTVGLGSWFKKRVGGYTGDFLGATEQVLEIALLLGLAVAARVGSLSP